MRAINVSPRIDKTTNDIAESVWRIEDMVKRHMEAFADISNSVQMLARDNERLKAAILPLEDMHAHAGRPPAQTHAAAHRSALDPPRGLPPGLSTVRPGDEDALTDDEAGDPVAPGKSSIPVNHTTGAARLLLCGPINELSKGVLKQKRVYENFPMWQEERRGCLRIYGRGEGNDFASGYDRDPLTDYGDDTASADASSDISSPAAGEEWGHVGGVEASPHGMPDFDRATVLKLVRAFKEHINNMHPLLVPSQLDALAENFLRSLPDGSARGRAADKLTPSGHAGFVVSSPNPVSPSSKRKRSATGELGEAFDPWASKPGHPFRSINSALVLTVLALGKICLHQGKLPDVHNDRNIDPTCGTGGSTAAHNGILQSPMTTSPIVPAVFSPPLPTTSPTLERGFPRSRRTSVEGSMNTPKSLARNLDLLPGLAYFALATDIIGNQLGGITLQHAHVNILAGLYHAQLARPLESYAYIQKASMIVQFLMRP